MPCLIMTTLVIPRALQSYTMTSIVTRLGLQWPYSNGKLLLAQAIDLPSAGSSRLVGANGMFLPLTIYQPEAFCATCDW